MIRFGGGLGNFDGGIENFGGGMTYSSAYCHTATARPDPSTTGTEGWVGISGRSARQPGGWLEVGRPRPFRAACNAAENDLAFLSMPCRTMLLRQCRSGLHPPLPSPSPLPTGSPSPLSTEPVLLKMTLTLWATGVGVQQGRKKAT